MLKTVGEMEQGLKRHLKGVCVCVCVCVCGWGVKGSVAFVCEKHLKREREKVVGKETGRSHQPKGRGSMFQGICAERKP